MSRAMNDKVVIVTGGSEGIGKAVCLRLAQEGARVIMCARRPGPLKEAETEIRKAGKVEAHILDVSDLNALTTLIHDTAKRYGRLDGLVNNAMSVTYKMIADTTIEDWRRDFAVNADAVFVATREAMKIMIPQKSGSIVNISSANGIRAMPAMSSYSASKAALVQFSAVAAMEGAPHNVRVNSIAPGQILTPAVVEFAKADPERANRSAAATPMGRSGEPHELASVVLFLLSDESSYVTGVCLPVDGGKAQQLYVPA